MQAQRPRGASKKKNLKGEVKPSVRGEEGMEEGV
jgi:hypothetical protein